MVSSFVQRRAVFEELRNHLHRLAFELDTAPEPHTPETIRQADWKLWPSTRGMCYVTLANCKCCCSPRILLG